MLSGKFEAIMMLCAVVFTLVVAASSGHSIGAKVAKTFLATTSLGVSGWVSHVSVPYDHKTQNGFPSSVLLSSESSQPARFIKTESGLQYVDVVRGDGALLEAGQTVRVNYAGWLDGFDGEKKFDSSYERRSPLVFKVGTRQVISGWDEALLTDMPVGTKRNVIVPADLGYGKRGAGGVIPPNADLYFTMELVGTGVR